MKNLTILTLDTPNITDFAKARNDLLKVAKKPAHNASHSDAGGDWILFLDTDENLTPELQAEIEQAIRSSAFNAYSIPRLDSFLGRELMHGEAGHTRLVRLARRSWGQWVRPVHEKWTGPGPIGILHNPILHTPHDSISSFLTKIDHYSSLDAQYRYTQKQYSSLLKIWLYPLAKFKLNYFLRLGILDGIPGLIHAIMMSFHSYLTHAKLYLLWHKK